MFYRYPPDADAMDVFPLEETDIDRILDIFDHDEEEAIEVALSFDGMTLVRLGDLLEWFGRRCDATDAAQEEADYAMHDLDDEEHDRSGGHY